MVTKTVDEYGRIEYKTWFLLSISFIAVFINLLVGGVFLYYTEVGVEGGNIKTFEDAVWLAYMMISTVGFGDHYPVTTCGRLVGMVCVLVGAINLGTFIAIGSSLIRTNNDVHNRQIMIALAEQTRMMQEFERKFKPKYKVDKDSHMLDEVFDQKVIDTKTEGVYGWVTSGRDSSGLLTLSIEFENNGTPLKKWIPADSLQHLEKLFNNYSTEEDIK